MSNINSAITAVYIISGARKMSAAFEAMAKLYEGEAALVESLIANVDRVERVYQVLAVQKSIDFGHWLFDVVEPYGAALLDMTHALNTSDDAVFNALIVYAQAASGCSIDDGTRAAARLAWDGMPAGEVYSTVWLSTAHITPGTLDMLNNTRSDDLPYWIHSTTYGWIVRFAEHQEQGTINGEPGYIFAECADLIAIGDYLKTFGLSAAHLDADGPIIGGLAAYEH